MAVTSVPRSIRQRAVFVDSSALFALVDATDQWHDEARRALTALISQARPLFTSNLVLTETYALVSRHFGPAAALDWLQGFDFSLVFQTPADHERASTLLSQHRGWGFSYVDTASFAIMEREATNTALAFDEHFRQYGWNLFTASES